ncbi:hypothetical protein [Actinoplanes cyaneus]|uniref:hypothetical protein n=1 Tax=Actinoplanes cyaneus TaxID=52696 RepID=UPI001EF206FC|nr:hypothetical protein [Actinoplanes cyaneus]
MDTFVVTGFLVGVALVLVTDGDGDRDGDGDSDGAGAADVSATDGRGTTLGEAGAARGISAGRGSAEAC